MPSRLTSNPEYGIGRPRADSRDYLEPVPIVDATIANRKPSPRLGVVVEFPLSVGTIP
jgi:hypothetical protein